MSEKRVRFDFEVDFSNGGGIQGQDFRLDIDSDEISNDALAAHIIQDLSLLMVAEVRILHKKIINEPHKRGSKTERPGGVDLKRSTIIDLSHPSSGEACSNTMSSNAGTILDAPFQRYSDGKDLSQIPLEFISDIPAVVVDVSGGADRAIDWHHFVPVQLRGKAVLVRTGWDKHWGTIRYVDGYPFLTKRAAEYLREQDSKLVGIDSPHTDDVRETQRLAQSTLLEAGIPVTTNLTNLQGLPIEGARLHVVPPKIMGVGTSPVRAHAIVAQI